MRDGSPVRRAITFYAHPPELNMWAHWGLDVPCPGEPIDPALWEEQSDYIERQAGLLYRDGMRTSEVGAVLLAGMMEIEPGAGSHLMCSMTTSTSL